MRYFIATISVLLLLMIGRPAMTQTPDGETPAEEHVCDVVKDATPGLYGLCVAFCEAQDADQCTVSDSRLLENYRKKMQLGDWDMPCLQGPCPCWSLSELEDASTAASGMCHLLHKPEVPPEGKVRTSSALARSKPVSWEFRISNALGKPGQPPKKPPACYFSFFNRETGEEYHRSFEIIQDEVVACYAHMIDLCEIIDP